MKGAAWVKLAAMPRNARNAARAVAACALSIPYLLAACGNKRAAPTDAGASATLGDARASADAGGPARDAAGPLAANELDVVRYEDESAVDHAALTIKTPFANAYRAYPKGDVVTTLKAGANVTQIAERNGYYLVTFDAPFPPARTLMGWMAKFAFDERVAAAMTADAGADAGAKVPRCVNDKLEYLALQDPVRRDYRCAYLCKDDLECKNSGAVCEAAILPEPSGAIVPATQFSTVCTDAGAGPIKPTRKIPSLFGVPHRGDGKCAAGFVTAPKTGTLCYRGCKVDADCPPNATCKLTVAKDAKLCHAND